MYKKEKNNCFQNSNRDSIADNRKFPTRQENWYENV